MKVIRRHCQDVFRKLRRLGTMNSTEMIYRSRQALSKHMDRVGVIRNRHSFWNTSSINGGLVNAGLLTALQTSSTINIASFKRGKDEVYNEEISKVFHDGFHDDTCATRFFPGVVDEQTPFSLENYDPTFVKEIIARADNMCKGYFDFLGYKQLCFGHPVDWHLDPVSGQRAPFRHWSRIDPLNYDMVGDSKVTWELNRHQWFVTLGQAYRCTGRERYAEIFAARIRAWIWSNPHGIGINWASSLEVGYRLISWCWALYLFRGSKALSADLYMQILESIHTQALHLERYLSLYFSPNTHLTGEALGLFYVGLLFPEFEQAKRWRTRGVEILSEQIESQVMPDGIYFEQSTCYQRYTVEMYLHFLILAQHHGITVPQTIEQRVLAMLDFLLAVRYPDGTMPQIGDNDGGSLLPLVQREPNNFSGLFAIAASYFKRADYAWAAGGLTAEVFWFFGTQGVQAFTALSPIPPANPPSRHFAHGGYAVMRNSWEKHAHQVIFDVGPLGCNVSAGHGHADLLSVQCASFGEPCLVDSGTGCYTADKAWRNYFRGTAAHNTLMVDGIHQAVPEGPFKWSHRPRARLRRWISTETYDLADADHDAYRGLPDPVVHRRRVLFVKSGYWLIVDDLKGQAEHRIDLCFQFAPLEVAVNTDNWGRARLAGGRECRFLVSAPTPLSFELIRGQAEPIQAWVSPDYGRREAAHQLVYSTTARLPLRILTLMFPVDNSLSVSPEVTVSDNHQRVSLMFADEVDTLLIRENDISLKRISREETVQARQYQSR